MPILGTLMGFSVLFGATAFPIVGDAAEPPSRPAPSYAVTLTAYNAVPAQTDDNPLETASGAYSNPEVVAARSQDLGEELPFGTIVEIDGSAAAGSGCGYDTVAPEVGYRVIADTMNKKFTNRVDVLLDDEPAYPTLDKGMKNAAQILGVCSGITIRVIGHLDINHMPKTQEELANLVKSANLELAVK